MYISPHEPSYYSRSAEVQPLYPTDDMWVIVRLVREVIAELYGTGCRFMEAGVGLIEIITRALGQNDLFTPGQSLRADQAGEGPDQEKVLSREAVSRS
ncbi:hypothetical protein ACJJIC_11020 [Microbulbifer sp. ANSA002]|uniref:hypothetical protein n=1 Tax=unclassified Microbulbifer TaxID=2619833 RepID=UPI00404135EE